jgi:choline transporter-like protein 2/4/5
MIWGSILGSIAIIFGVAVYAYESAQQWRLVDPPVRSDFDIQGTEILSYCLFGVGAIIVFITIFLRKQIMLAMGCVREAARAIGSMPVIVLFPVIQTIGFFMFFAVWAVFAVYLASTGTIGELVLPTTAVVTVRTYQFDDFTTYCGWYLLFVLLWTIGFIQAMGQIVIAMCVAKWYFSREKWKVGSLAVFKCIKDSFKFHLGTAAFGSFIVAVVQIIRIIVAKAQKRAKEMGNKIGEALLCCCQCCLWCFEKFIKFLNKNAYIQTAIFGTPFCRSARESFLLIARNAGKVGSISYVSTIVLFVGKLFISCLTTGVAYIYMDSQIGEEVYSLGGPLLFIFVMSYFIGDMFLDIFDMSTNTILHCFVADEEMFADEDGGVDKCYAEGQLREWLDDHDKSERKIVGAR